MSGSAVSNATFNEDSIEFASTQYYQNSQNVNVQNDSAVLNSTDISSTSPAKDIDPRNYVCDNTLLRCANSVRSCVKCPRSDDNCMLQCATCRSWLHYGCTNLPQYQLYAFSRTSRKFECEKCVRVTDTFIKQVHSSRSSAHTASPIPVARPTKNADNDILQSKTAINDIINNATKISGRHTQCDTNEECEHGPKEPNCH